MILCVTGYPGVPSIRLCRARGLHLDTCTDDLCTGCYPRAADRGFLCSFCFDRLEHAYARWPEFEARFRALEGERAVRRDTGGVRTRVEGHANFTPGFLAVDEAAGFLAGAAGHASLEIWCGTETGAAAAIQFAAAAERAYRAVEVEERPHRLRKAACPTFDCQGVLVWTPPAWFEKPVMIRCTDCGATVSQDAYDYRETA